MWMQPQALYQAFVGKPFFYKEVEFVTLWQIDVRM
jgi:hypothetical protein